MAQLKQSDPRPEGIQQVLTEVEALALEIDELCPHEPDEHAEGTCDVCDLAFAATGLVTALVERLQESVVTTQPNQVSPCPACTLRAEYWTREAETCTRWAEARTQLAEGRAEFWTQLAEDCTWRAERWTRRAETCTEHKGLTP